MRIFDADVTGSLHVSGSSELKGNLVVSGSQTITGSLTVDGNTKFGDQISDNHNFTGSVNISGSHTLTGSLNLLGNQIVSGSVYILNDLIVQGSSSLENITASAVSIGTNTIILNSDSPGVRYAGISVFDSGSTTVTASLFYDSLTDNWKFHHSDVDYNDASILIFGPLGTDLDTAPELVGNFLTKVENNGHGHHITTSSIFDNGTKVSINSNSEITGSLIVTNGLSGSLDYSYLINVPSLISGSSQISSLGFITGYTDTNTFTTGATFNTSNGVVTFTKNDGGTYTVDIDGRFLTSYTETDTLDSVVQRGGTTTATLTAPTFRTTGGNNTQFVKGDGSLDGNLYLTSHPSVSAASSSNNSGRTYIQDILLDSFGHITGITTATETVVDTYTTGGTTNSTTGLITFTKSDGNTYTTSISGYVSTQIANLVDSAPTTLDTLNELAAALGDDPNFATTISTAIGNKVSKSGDTMSGNLTAPKFITSGGTSSQFVKGDGTLDSNTYLTSYSETDTLSTVTARGASTSTPVTFNGDVKLGNAADLTFVDLAGTFPTSGKGFDWTLNNDGARIYAIQPSSDSIDLVFQLRDNATTNDRFVFWVDDYQGPAFDKYPLIIRGGTEFDLVNSALYVGGTLVLSNGRVLENVTGNISMFTNDSGYLTAHPSVSAASSSNNSGRTYIQDILLDSFGHITGITTASETVTDTFTTGATFNTGNGIITFTNNNGGGTFTVDIDGRFLTSYTETQTLQDVTDLGNITTRDITARSFIVTGANATHFLKGDGTLDSNTYLTAHPSVSAASSSNNSGRTYIQDILLDSFGHITGITTATETVVDTNNFTTGATTNGTTGLITFTKNDGGTYTTSISGYVTTQITNLIDSAPSTLDTLNELAAALGDDPNFATTIATSIGNKVSKSGDTMTGNLSIFKNDTTLTLGQINASTGFTTIEMYAGNGGAFNGYSIRYNKDATFDRLEFIDGGGTARIYFENGGVINAAAIKKIGGLSTQFLKADGSVDSSTYLTAHPSVSAASSSNNSGRTYIQDILLDSFGHITGITTATETVTDTNTFITGATFNTGDGVVTITKNDGNTVTVDLDGRYQLSGSYLTGYTETDTLATVTARGNTTNQAITVSGVTSYNDVVISGGTLTVYESVSGATVFAVDGTNGRLFAVTDDLSNSLFSVNTISGLPVIEAFADYRIVMGRFNQNDFYLGTTGEIGMGSLPVSGFKLAVTGNVRATSFVKSGGTSSQFLKADGSVDSNTYLTAHPSVSAASSSNNSGRTYIQDILLDSFGHITGITTASETVTDTFTTGATFNTGDGVITFTNNNGGGTFTVDIDGRYQAAGSYLTAESDTLDSVAQRGGTTTATLTAPTFRTTGGNNTQFVKGDGSLDGNLYLTSHPSVSAASSSNNSGRTYIQDILLDSFGHITGITTATETVVNTDIFTTGATFNTSNGIITFNRNDGNNYTVDIDGKYAESSHTHSIDSITDEHRLFNNMGDNHSTQTDFNAIGNFGARFVQGTTNGPGTGSSQFYGFTLGLGNEYGIDQYALQLALPRYGSSDKYISIRTKEASSWGSWYKIHAGYADTAGDADTLDGQHGSYYYPASNPSAYISSYLNYFTTGATFNTSNGVITFSRNDGNTYTVDIDGKYAESVHIHDDRYLPYEKTNDVAKTVGWYTIAVNNGNRATGKFILRDTSSGNHQSTVFYATHHFGLHSDITVLINSAYSGSPFRYIRIVDGSTYDGALLQIYVDSDGSQVQAWLLEDIQNAGWIIKDWVPDGVDPGDVPNFPAMVETPAQVDLDNTPVGGIITTGPIFGGGNTTQYEYLNTNNYSTTTDTRYYTETEIGNFFGGSSAITGYNKSNWDTAFGWGNHGTQGYATTGYVQTQITNLIDGAPALLDTLNELAAAIGDDANFASTVTTSIGNKVSKSGDTMTGNLSFGATSNLGLTWGLNTDAAFIKFISTSNAAGGSYLEIGTQDDSDEEIKFTQSGNLRFYLATDGLLKNASGYKYVFENGTWGINISGNAATVTNGVYDNGSYSNPAWITALAGSKVTGNISGNASNITSYTINQNLGTGDTPTFSVVRASRFEASASSTRNKLSLWGTDTNYTIGMESGVSFGGLNDYAMTFQFNNEDDRGFWWGDTAHSTAQGAMALTTNGYLTVARGVRVGYGESDTTTPNVPLQVYGSGSLVFDVQGSLGQLFSVTDSLSGSLFSVNDVSGLPILEVFSDDKLVAGSYGTNAFVVSGTTTTVSGSFAVSGSATVNGGTVWHSGNDGASSGLDADLLDGLHASSFLTAHPSVSAAGSSNNSGRTYIQDILLDSFGHITGITTATETVVDTDTNYYVTSATFNTSDGVVTLTRNDGGTVTVDIDGKYLDSSSYTASDVLSKLLTVDGSGSGLDADLLDGNNSSYFINTSNIGSQSVSYASTAGFSDEAKWISFPDGPRDLSDRRPNWNNRSVAWDFVGAGTANGSGNYGGVMTFSPWDGTSSSTGDSSYQLAFANASGVNASGQPKLSIRNGIDTTWNSWYTLIHEGNISSYTSAHISVSAASSSNNSGRTYIQDILLDSFGHITGITTATETVVDTDTNYYVTSASFNTSNGIITLTRNDGGTVTVDIDGKYAESSHTHDDRYFTETESDARFQPLENQRLSTGNSPTFVDIYANEWFRNNNANEGLYNTTTTQHWSSQANGYWDASSTTSVSAIRFYTGGHVSALRGHVYANSSNEIGFLNSGGNWGLRMDNSYNVQIYGALTVGSGTSSDIYMTDTDETTRRIHCNSSRIGFLSSSNTWGSWAANDGSWNSDQSVRAPIFYDISDTNYYLNPNGYSNLGTVRFNSSGANAEVVAVDGVNGRLFTVTDDMTDSIFSVNTISGLPVIEAFADYTVVMGRYGQNDFKINGADGVVTIRGNTVWHAGNDGASSGLDADLLDGQHGSYYAAASSLSNYLPLAGGTMTGTITITNNDIRSNATSNWTGDPGTQGKIQYHSNRWYIVADQDSNRIVQFRRNGTDVSYIANDGVFHGNVSGNVSGNASTATNVAYSGLTGTVPTWNQNTSGNAATATYATSAGSAPNAGNVNPFYNVTAGDGNGLRFWGGSDEYKISMGVGGLYQYGPVTDYSIKTQMDPGSTGRGFTWGNNGVTPVAALNATSGNMEIKGLFTASNFSGSSSGTNTGDQTNISGNAATVGGITPIQFFNNMGDSHGTRTSFDASTPSYNFGFRFVQGNTNGPALGGGGQFYSWYLGLGNDYPATGAGSYGMHVAIPRTATTPYMSVRYNENNSLGSWIKIAAGYADTAGALTSMNISQFTNNSGYITSYVDTNYYVTGATFNTSTGVITMTRNDGGTVTVDIDGKYAESSHTHDDRYFTETESDARFQPLENQRLSTGNSPSFSQVFTTQIGINDSGIDCYMEVGDGNPTEDGINYGGTFHFYGDKTIGLSHLYFGGAYVTNNFVVGGRITENSSIRYKKDIETLEGGLDKVLAMRGVTYVKKDTGIKEVGLIAEELAEILPEVVGFDTQGQPDSVSYSRITAILIEAIKDLKKEIDELKGKK